MAVRPGVGIVHVPLSFIQVDLGQWRHGWFTKHHAGTTVHAVHVRFAGFSSRQVHVLGLHALGLMMAASMPVSV